MSSLELEGFCAAVLDRAVQTAQKEPVNTRLSDVVAEVLATLPSDLIGALDGANVPAEVHEILMRIIRRRIQDPSEWPQEPR